MTASVVSRAVWRSISALPATAGLRRESLPKIALQLENDGPAGHNRSGDTRVRQKRFGKAVAIVASGVASTTIFVPTVTRL